MLQYPQPDTSKRGKPDIIILGLHAIARIIIGFCQCGYVFDVKSGGLIEVPGATKAGAAVE